MHSAIISPEHLTALYRFTVLLTGSATSAETIVVEVLSEVSGHAAQIRSAKSRNALLISKIHGRCLKTPPPPPGEAGGENGGGGESGAGIPVGSLSFVRHFSTLAEPGRSALALFYADLFPASEMAGLLGLGLEELGDALEAARSALGVFTRPAGAAEAGS